MAATANWWDAYPDAPVNPIAAQAAAAPAAPAPSGKSNWWDTYPDAAPPMTDGKDSFLGVINDTAGDVMNSTASGVAQGVAAAPYVGADMGNMIAKGGRWAAGKIYNALADKPLTPEQQARLDNEPNPFYSSQEILKPAEDLTGLHPYQPTTALGGAANTVGQFIGGGRMMGAANPALQATTGQLVSGGVAAAGAQNMFPNSDLAPMIAGAIGMGAAGIGAGAADAAKSKLSNMGVGPKTDIAPGVRATQGQMQTAGQQILDASADPEALKASLSEAPRTDPDAVGPMPQNNSGVIVPGSKPTLAEVANDSGITQWQDAQQSANRGAFNQRRADQNAARNSFIDETGGAGNADDVGKFFTSQLDQLTNQGESAINSAKSNVQSQTAALGGSGTPEEYGADLRENITNAAAPQKAQYQQLWKALEPYDKAPIDGSGIQETVSGLNSTLDRKAAQTFAAKETPIYNAIKSWTVEDPPTFGTLRALNGEVNSAIQSMKQSEGFQSAPVMRMQNVKAAVTQAIEDNVNGIKSYEKQAIANGEMKPEESASARLEAMRDEWYAKQNAEQTPTGPVGSSSGQGYATGTSKAVSGVGGAAGKVAGRSGSAEGTESVSENAPKLDKNAQDTYAAYKAARHEYGNTYQAGSVGKVLKNGERVGEYAVPDSLVARKFFHSGDNSPANIAEYVKAVGGKPEAIDKLKDYAVSDLVRPGRGIIKDDGSINQQKFNQWMRQHDRALSSFPDLKKQLSNIGKAQDVVNDAMANHKNALDDFNKSRATLFIKNDPVKAVGKAFNDGKPAEAFADLVKKAAQDPTGQATQGLKRATADYILQNVRGEIPDGGKVIDVTDPKKFRKFIIQHNQALKTVFGGQGLNNLERVAMDIRRTSEIMKGAKIPGQSNTTQDMLNAVKHAQPSDLSIMGHLTPKSAEGSGLIGGLMGEMLGHPLIGAAVGAGSKMVNAFRQAGVNNIKQLHLEAALSPDIAGQLIRSVKSKEIPIPVQNRVSSAFMQNHPLINKAVQKAESAGRQVGKIIPPTVSSDAQQDKKSMSNP